jgi:hypothetical protein
MELIWSKWSETVMISDEEAARQADADCLLVNMYQPLSPPVSINLLLIAITIVACASLQPESLLVSLLLANDFGPKRDTSIMSEPSNKDPARAAESNLGWILGVNVVFHALAIVFVSLGIYTRVAIVKTFGRDDVMLLFAIVSTPS